MEPQPNTKQQTKNTIPISSDVCGVSKAKSYPLIVISILNDLSMSKKSPWYKSVWAFIVGLSVILGLVASFLQISGMVNFGSSFIFLSTSLPLYFTIFLLFAVILIVYLATKWRKRRTNILDFEDARKIALLCQTPRTTEFLRQQYAHWQSQSTWVFLGGYGFDDYMKRLEKQGYLTYLDEV